MIDMGSKARSWGTGRVLVGVLCFSAVCHTPLRAVEDEYQFRAQGWLDLPGLEMESVWELRAAAGDFDDDGAVEVAVQFFSGDPPQSKLRFYRQSGPNHWSPTKEIFIATTRGVAAIDLNGDGHLDIVGSESILLGDGTGDFRQVAEAEVALEPSKLLVADVDRDGALDLIDGGDGLVLFGPNFQSLRRVEAFEGIEGLAAVDVDGDGLVELVASAFVFEPFLRVVETDATREFGAVTDVPEGPFSRVSTVRFATGEPPTVVGLGSSGVTAYTLRRDAESWTASSELLVERSGSPSNVIVEDLDGDGAEELIVFDFGSSGFSVWFGTRQSGRLAFDSPVQQIGSIGVSSLPSQIVDLDGDGLKDLLFDTGFVRTLRAGQMGGARVISEGRRNLSSAAAFDLNDDGFDDLIRGVGGEVFVQHGSADGLSAAEKVADGRRVFEIQAGRLRADGNPWVLVDSVLYEVNELGEFLGPIEPEISAQRARLVEWMGESRLLVYSPGIARLRLLDVEPTNGSITEIWSIRAPEAGASASVVDLDADGWHDLVFGSAGGARIIRGTESGPRSASAVIESVDVTGLAAIDIDRDGVDEIIVNGEELSVLWSDRAGAWSAEVLADDIGDGLSLVSDFRGDEAPDLLAFGSGRAGIFVNEDGVLIRVDEFPSSGTPFALAVGDFDQDDQIDFVGATERTIDVSFPGPTGDLPRPVFVGEIFVRGVGDLNGDGYSDIFGESVDDGTVMAVILRNDDGSVAARQNYSFPGPVRLVAADVMEDGNVDVIGSSSSVHGVFVYPGIGDGILGSPIELQHVDSDNLCLAAADFNEDGKADFVVASRSTGMHLYTGVGPDASFLPPSLVAAPLNYRSVHACDLNLDGHQDILFSVGTDQDVSVYAGNGDGTFSPEAIEVPLALPESQVLGLPAIVDINGDGRLDGFSHRTGVLQVHLGLEGFLFDSTDMPIDEAHTPVALVDADRDGAVDVVGRSTGGLFFVQDLEDSLDPEKPRVFEGDIFGALAVEGGRYEFLGNFGRTGELYLFPFVEGSPIASTRVRSLRDNYARSATAGDLDADGLPELILYHEDHTIAIYSIDAERQVNVMQRIVLEDRELGHLSLAAHDLDSDGIVDLVYVDGDSAYWHRASEALVFDAPQRIATDVRGSGGLRFRDLNGDGLVDLFADGFSIALARSSGGFEPGRGFRPSRVTVTPNAIGDFDGDGHLDVAHAWRARDETPIFIAHGDAAGGFQTIESLPGLPDENGWVAVGDYDGNNRLDVVFAPSGSKIPERPRVWYGEEFGDSLRRGADLDARGAERQRGTARLTARDLNRDGYDDLIEVRGDGITAFYPGSHEGVRSAAWLGFGLLSPRAFVQGHFVGDDEIMDFVLGDDEVVFEIAGDIVTTSTGAAQLAGDCDQSGSITLTDGVCIVGVLFLGQPDFFPCGSGVASDSANVTLLDMDLSGDLDVTDAVSLLSYLFLGITPPAFGDGVPTCRTIEGCAAVNPGC